MSCTQVRNCFNDLENLPTMCLSGIQLALPKPSQLGEFYESLSSFKAMENLYTTLKGFTAFNSKITNFKVSFQKVMGYVLYTS